MQPWLARAALVAKKLLGVGVVQVDAVWVGEAEFYPPERVGRAGALDKAVLARTRARPVDRRGVDTLAAAVDVEAALGEVACPVTPHERDRLGPSNAARHAPRRVEDRGLDGIREHRRHPTSKTDHDVHAPVRAPRLDGPQFKGREVDHQVPLP